MCPSRPYDGLPFGLPGRLTAPAGKTLETACTINASQGTDNASFMADRQAQAALAGRLAAGRRGERDDVLIRYRLTFLQQHSREGVARWRLTPT